jgi:hypothetical protein
MRPPKEDAVSHGVIIRHQPHDEISAINAQCITPNSIIVWRYPTPTVLKLGNSGVIFESYLVGHFPLRQATPFAQMAQPVAGLNAQIPGSRWANRRSGPRHRTLLLLGQRIRMIGLTIELLQPRAALRGASWGSAPAGSGHVDTKTDRRLAGWTGLEPRRPFKR